MAVLLNDNNNRVNYRIEINASDGRVLVTEGTASEAHIKADYNDGEEITLKGSGHDRKQFFVGAPSAEEPEVDTDPEPVAPIKPRVAPAFGTNPYVDRDKLMDGQEFITSYNNESYELERENYGDERLILGVRDEEGDAIFIYLTPRERVEMAIRLLSVTKDDILVSNSESAFIVDKNVSDEEVPRGIGSAIFTLHAHLEDLKHQERVEAYEAEHSKWEQRQAEKVVGMSEDEALHELVVRDILEETGTADVDYMREVEAGQGIENVYPNTYAAYKRRVVDRLEDCDLTAIQQLANVLDDEKKADTSEEDALDAIALDYINNHRARGRAYSMEEAKLLFGPTFPAHVVASRRVIGKLGVTAVQYAKAHSIKFPAA